MSAGSAMIRVLLVALNLSIVGIVALSAVTLASDFQVDFDEEDVDFGFDENGILLNLPIGIKFGGYWDIEGFYYRLALLDEDHNLIAGDGGDDITLKHDQMNNLNIRAELSMDDLMDHLGEELFLTGVTVYLTVELGARYMADLFQFDLDLDLKVSLDPMLKEYGVSDFSYAAGKITFQLDHETSDMFGDMVLEMGAKILSDNYELGFDTFDVDFSHDHTIVEISVNENDMQSAIIAEEMIVAKVGLMEGSELGPHVTINLFQLQSLVYNAYGDPTELRVDIVMKTFSAIPGSIEIMGEIFGDNPTPTSIAGPISINLNTTDSGTLVFTINPLDYSQGDFTLTLSMAMHGLTWEITKTGGVPP